MKNLKNLSIFSIALALTFIACTKETEVNLSFPFVLNETHNEIATINYQEPTLIKVDPEKTVTDNTYSFSYKISEGNGYLRYASGENLEQDTFYDCENLELNFQFIGTELGQASIEFTVVDLYERQESIQLLYNVIDNSFIWDSNSTISSVTTNQEVPLSLILENTGIDDNVIYLSKIFFSQGAGVLYETNSNGDSTDEIELNQYYDISEDIYTYNVKMTETGVNKIIFEALDSNGQIKQDSLIYNVDVNDFYYLGTPQNNSVFVGSQTNLNFQITELIGSGDTYESRFEFVSGNATIKKEIVGGTTEVLYSGVSYEVEANEYSWIFEANDVGPIEMIFYAKSSSDIEHQVSINIDVISGSFSINASPSQNIASVNDEVVVNINISENGPSGLPYDFQYSSSANGVFIYNNNQYLPGANIEINELNFSGLYKGLIEENHIINFTATSSYNESRDDEISIEFNQDIFSFTAISEVENVTLNDTTNFNFNVTDDNTNASYQMYYTATGNGTGELSSAGNIFTAGTFYDITNTGFSWEFKATQIGPIEYTFYVINNSGVEIQRTININVVEIPADDYTFSVISTSNQEVVGTSVPLNMTINETVGNSSYKMTYTSSASGVLIYQGNEYLQGDPIDVTVGSFSASYLGLVSGQHDIVFSVENDNTIPVVREAEELITFENIDFEVSTNGNGELFINQTKDFNLFLSQLQSDPSITYSAIFTIANGSSGGGTITTVNGDPIGLGASQDINIGTNELVFNANAIGNVTLNINVIDSNGQSKQTAIEFDVVNADFIFDGAPQQNEIGVGGNTDLIFGITENTSTGANYEMKYVITSGSGTVTNAGNTLTANTYYDVNIGNFSWNIEAGPVAGTIEIFCTARNKVTLETKDVTIQITVTNAPISDYTFSAVSSSNQEIVGSSVPVNINIQELVGNSTYTLSFTTSGNGIVSYQGNDYFQGDPIEVPVGAFVVNYLGNSPGNHNIEFTATNTNAIPISKSDTDSIIFDNINFTFDVDEEDGEIILNEETNVIFNINDVNNSGSEYQIKYIISSSDSAEFINNGLSVMPNEFINILSGSSFWTFKGIEAGTIEIEFTVRNLSTSEEKTDTSRIIVNPEIVPDFNFSSIPSQTSTTLGNCMNINFNIEELQSQSGAPYEMVFTSSFNGVFEFGGNSYNQGEIINVPSGSFVGCFIGEIVENYDIDFTVSNSNTPNITKDDNVSIEFTPQSNFELIGNLIGSEVLINNNSQITLDINELVGNSNYTFNYINNSTGELFYQGNIINESQNYSINTGQSGFSYKPTTLGTHNLIFKVSNSNSIPITKTYSAQIVVNDLNINVSTDQITILEGKSRNIEIELLETGSWTIAFNNSDAIKSGSIFSAILGNINYNQEYNLTSGLSNFNFIANSSTDMVIELVITNGINTFFKSIPIEVIPTFRDLGSGENSIVKFKKVNVTNSVGIGGGCLQGRTHVASYLLPNDFIATNQILDKIIIADDTNGSNAIEIDINFDDTISTNNYTNGGSSGIESGSVVNNVLELYNSSSWGAPARANNGIGSSCGSVYFNDMDNITTAINDKFNPGNSFYVKFVTVSGKESYYTRFDSINYDNWILW